MLALARGLSLRGGLGAATELLGAGWARAGFSASATAAAAKPVVEKEFLIYRWDPDSGEAPRYDSYKVDINA